MKNFLESGIHNENHVLEKTTSTPACKLHYETKSSCWWASCVLDLHMQLRQMFTQSFLHDLKAASPTWSVSFNATIILRLYSYHVCHKAWNLAKDGPNSEQTSDYTSVSPLTGWLLLCVCKTFSTNFGFLLCTAVKCFAHDINKDTETRNKDFAYFNDNTGITYKCTSGHSFTPDDHTDTEQTVQCQENGKLEKLKAPHCKGICHILIRMKTVYWSWISSFQDSAIHNLGWYQFSLYGGSSYVVMIHCLSPCFSTDRQIVSWKNQKPHRTVSRHWLCYQCPPRYLYFLMLSSLLGS